MINSGMGQRVFAQTEKDVNWRQTTTAMSTIELRKRLIDKIQKTDDDNLLQEAYRLLELGTEDIEPYRLSEDQKNAIKEARQQIKDGQFLTNDQADKEIDEWLCQVNA